MTSFRFRLDTLLKLRRVALDERRAKLAEMLRAEAMFNEQSQQLERQMTAAQDHRRAATSACPVDVDAVLHAQRYEWSLQGERRRLQEQQQKLAEALERQRRLVIAADRDVKVLEKLRERRLAEHLAAENAREIKHLDEVASRRRENL